MSVMQQGAVTQGRLVVVGYPNCGKSTLFNQLTGSSQRVGNWSGVMVERKEGTICQGNTKATIIDLPGVRTLLGHEEEVAVDKAITRRYLLQGSFDVIVNVVDATHLERQLYLTKQLLELGCPLIVVLNMYDVACRRQQKIDIHELQRVLGCPVVVTTANRGVGITALKRAMLNVCHGPEIVSVANQSCEDEKSAVPKRSQQEYSNDDDLAIANARYQWIRTVMAKVAMRKTAYQPNRLDRLFLHRYVGLPLFLLVMYGLFVFAINIGGLFQDFFDQVSYLLFVTTPTYYLQQWHAPPWLIALLANGIGRGLNTTLTFVPVIASLFLGLTFLEDCGYIARASFVIDRVMRLLKLPGESFIPMVIGFGCNVPAVMAARTLRSPRERLLTMLMSPFSACSARLAIFTIFCAAFFPHGGQNVVFGLYLLGLVVALLTAWLLRHTLLPGRTSPLLMDLPAYHWPQWSNLRRQMWFRLRHFIWRAGKLIVPVSVVLGLMGGLHGGLEQLGKRMTPLFAPMGLTMTNWPATVGLLTGVLAKEVVVGALNVLYLQVAHVGHMVTHVLDFWGGMKQAFGSIVTHVKALPQALQNPVLAATPEHTLSSKVYGVMVHRFNGKAGALAYLIFVLLYVPCISTVAAIRKESTAKWAWFSVIWSLLLAYSCAVIYYQLARWSLHPGTTLLWVTGLLLLLGGVILALRWLVQRGGVSVDAAGLSQRQRQCGRSCFGCELSSRHAKR